MTEFRRAVFVDTAAYFAIANSNDESHESAVAIWRELIELDRPIVTSNYIVAEFHALMVRTFGQTIALSAYDRLMAGADDVLRVSQDEEDSALAILRRYTDKTYTFVDAMSFVLVQNRRIPTVFTFDRHFVQHGFNVIGVEA